MFVTQDEFKGDIQITQSADISSNLTEIIEKSEKKYLRLLLGDDLYLKLIADLNNGIPQTQKYKDLMDGVTYSNGARNIIYDGLRQMLRYFCYSEYIKINYVDTSIGFVKQDKVNSDNIGNLFTEDNSNKAFNKGLQLYKSAYVFIIYKLDDYPTFSYTDLKYKSLFTK